MKKIIIIFIYILIVFVPISYAIDEDQITKEDIISQQIKELNIENFLTESKKYSGEILNGIEVSEMFNSAVAGKIDNKTFANKIVSLFGTEIKSTLKILGSIIVIIIIHSLLKSISDSLENQGISQITYYVQYILIVTIIMSNFTEVIKFEKDAIQNLVGYSQTLVPVLMSLMLATGNIASVGVIEPIILFLINLISNAFEVVIIPIVLVSTAISVVSKVSDKIQIDKISKFMKSSIIWILGVTLTLFVSIISLDGTLTSTVDGVTAKTAKAAVSNLIPVVGKVLGDAVDTVIGCSNILKNAVGVIGVLIIISICIAPIIKLVFFTISYKLTAALCQPIADEKIVKLLDEMGDTFKILLAIMLSISVMLIIGTTLVLKISNSQLMYR